MGEENIKQTATEDTTSETVATPERDEEISDQTEKGTKTFTQADVDRIIADRVKREKESAFEAGAKHAKEQAEKTQKAKEYESLNTKEKLERAEKELESYRAKETHREMLSQAKAQAAEANLTYQIPDEVLEVLIKDDDGSATKKAVDQMIETVKTMYDDIRTELLKGKTPKVPKTSGQSSSFGEREAQSRNARSHQSSQVKSNWG